VFTPVSTRQGGWVPPGLQEGHAGRNISAGHVSDRVAGGSAVAFIGTTDLRHRARGLRAADLKGIGGPGHGQRTWCSRARYHTHGNRRLRGSRDALKEFPGTSRSFCCRRTPCYARPAGRRPAQGDAESEIQRRRVDGILAANDAMAFGRDRRRSRNGNQPAAPHPWSPPKPDWSVTSAVPGFTPPVVRNQTLGTQPSNNRNGKISPLRPAPICGRAVACVLLLKTEYVGSSPEPSPTPTMVHRWNCAPRDRRTPITICGCRGVNECPAPRTAAATHPGSLHRHRQVLGSNLRPGATHLREDLNWLQLAAPVLLEGKYGHRAISNAVAGTPACQHNVKRVQSQCTLSHAIGHDHVARRSRGGHRPSIIPRAKRNGMRNTRVACVFLRGCCPARAAVGRGAVCGRQQGNEVTRTMRRSVFIAPVRWRYLVGPGRSTFRIRFREFFCVGFFTHWALTGPLALPRSVRAQQAAFFVAWSGITCSYYGGTLISAFAKSSANNAPHQWTLPYRGKFFRREK